MKIKNNKLSKPLKRFIKNTLNTKVKIFISFKAKRSNKDQKVLAKIYFKNGYDNYYFDNKSKHNIYTNANEFSVKQIMKLIKLNGVKSIKLYEDK